MTDTHAPRQQTPRTRSARAARAVEPRPVIEHIRPIVDCGALPAKAVVGQPLEVSADVYADGHDLLAVAVRHGSPAAAQRATADGRADRADVAMAAVGNDRWSARITPREVGPSQFEVVAIPDDYGTWLRDLRRRAEAGQDLDIEFEVGAQFAAARRPRQSPDDVRALDALAAVLRDPARNAADRIAAAGDPTAVALMRRTADWASAASSGPLPLFVDRERAGFSAWYEMFPRSEGAVLPRTSGTFRTAMQRLPAIAAMGFDIVYLPPVHPIGYTHRKGRNNTLGAGPDDPGSPWAIGSEAGGHTAIEPALGTLEDFGVFVREAEANGLEVAIDLALQCSPDHPWVREHPQWFKHRPDGSIRYAENPPKRYQDIYPLDFDTTDRVALEQAVLEVVRFWIGHGVHVFRVDNPHTKPLDFWRRLISEVHRDAPEVLFLSEAFTRPKVMERLAKNGFTQSYTYFTWRNAKWELVEYLGELANTERVDWMRPNFWPNTPDILHETLQRGGPPAFRLRLVLAALASPNWGMYSGYELCENLPLREGSEEYLDSEKYQLKPRDWDAPGSIAPLVTLVNTIRRRHQAAVSQLRTLRLHHIDSDQLLCFSRMDDARSDVLLVIVNLDPFAAHEGTTWLDLDELGIPWDVAFEAHDELTGITYVWQGPSNYVRLDPDVQAAHVFHLRPR